MADSSISKLDKTDLQILDTLQQDGRTPIVDRATKVGLTATPGARRPLQHRARNAQTLGSRAG